MPQRGQMLSVNSFNTHFTKQVWRGASVNLGSGQRSKRREQDEGDDRYLSKKTQQGELLACGGRSILLTVGEFPTSGPASVPRRLVKRAHVMSGTYDQGHFLPWARGD